MRYSIHVVAAAALSAAVFGPPAQAQDLVTQSFGGTTIWVGGGVQYLTLPDIKFLGTAGNTFQGPPVNVRRHQSDSDFGEYGGAFGGGIETALGFWGDRRVTGAIKGFFANMDDDRTTVCYADCVVIAPTGNTGAVTFGSLTNKTDRDVDYWGGQVEFKFAKAEPVQVRPNVYRNDFFIVGADIRGIDQDNRLGGRFGSDVAPFAPDLDFTQPYIYRETLDTTYYGAYVGFGGEYSLGFLGAAGVTGILDRLGLRSFVSVRGGLYSAETDFDGRFSAVGLWREFLQTVAIPPVPVDTRLVKSNSELAFIGSISFETRKPIGPRASLSLWTDYEYISSVPEISYASGFVEAGARPTRIDDDWAFASRTMLRLNIGLGSAQLYPAAPAYK